MVIMQYKITAIHGDWDAQYGKRRVSFSVEGNDNKISGFFQSVPQVGSTLEGDITQKGAYWNFNFPKKSVSPAGVASPDSERIYREVYATRQNLQILVQRLEEANVIPKKAGVPYPEAGVDDISGDNIPF